MPSKDDDKDTSIFMEYKIFEICLVKFYLQHYYCITDLKIL